MLSYLSFIQEENRTISSSELKTLEKLLDKLFEKVGIDINFTKHFFDRVNDRRNKKPITIEELASLFKKTFKKYKNKLKQNRTGLDAVLDDLQTNINIPITLRWNNKDQEIDLVAKTVMRNKNFKTKDIKLKV